MARNPNFSSTMRIDLVPSSNDPTSAEGKSSQQEARVHKGKRSAPTQCDLVGSADFRQLLQSIYDAAFIANLDGWILSGNERAVQFFQYEVSQFSGLHITTLLSGSDELLMATICESLQNDRFILIQAYCTRADGSVFPAEVSVNLIRISDTDYLNFFIRDVTLRKEAEDRLRTGHAAIQNSGNGIAITDTKATLQYHNPAMETLLAVDDYDQLAEANITSFLSNATVGDAIMGAVANGLTWTGELEMLCLDDETLFVQASVAPNTNAESEVVGMVWSLLDISDQKRARQELEERNAQMEEDLSLAREFQQAFIQRDYPTFPPGVDSDASMLELSHVYLPSGAVGGDFFEIFSVSENRVGVFISDVMGHGVRSALVVATIRGLIEELGPERYDPAAFLSHMNRDLTRIIKHHGHVTFATAFYMVLDLTNGSIVYASAGHPSPFVLSATSQTVDALEPEAGKQGPALGIFGATAYESTTRAIAPGDSIMLYTDGIFEAECAANCECFELDRLASLLAENLNTSPAELLPLLLERVQEFCNQDDFDDDVCLVGLKLKGFLAGESGGWAVD
jgi:phosphoserine phosphatase RsbU/P